MVEDDERMRIIARPFFRYENVHVTRFSFVRLISTRFFIRYEYSITMGLSSSKEQMMAKAIESQDLDAVKALIKELGPESMRLMCKSVVPDNENQCTMLHYATWQGRIHE